MKNKMSTPALFKKEWSVEFKLYRDKLRESLANLKYQLSIKEQELSSKETSINALIERMIEIENDLKYEVRLNERLREELSKQSLTIL